jgi:putative FmdB family regulatory protein
MPIYEYRCNLCGQEHVVLQKVTEPPLTDCPSCGKPGLQKLLTAAGFHLKGGGWYATDFKGGSKKKPEDKSKPETKTEPKTDTKPDTKPDTKTETKSTACTD